MSSHVVLPVELLVADLARVGVPVQVSGHIMPVEVAGVGVGVVADLAAVGVLWWSFIGAEAADADRVGRLRRAETIAGVGIEIGQLRLNLLLHLEVHEIWTGAGGAWVRVNTASWTGLAAKLLLRRFGGERVDH